MKLLLIILTLNTLVSFSQTKHSIVDIDSPKDYSDFNSFFGDAVLNDYKIFFTGENHQFANVNSVFEFKFLTYLNKTQQVNHFLFEQSPAVGYIMTGVVLDDNFKFESFLEDKYSLPFYDLVLDIKKYNKTVDSLSKIRVHGIDVERFPYFSIFALNHIVQNLPITGETGLIYESIQALGTSEFLESSADEIYNEGGKRVNLTGDAVDAWETFKTIISESEKQKIKLKEELGVDYDIYNQIIESVKKGREWFMTERKGNLSAPVLRERYMFAQFLNVFSSYSNAKFYGQFGRCHLHANKNAKRCYSHDMKSIASRINTSNDSLLKGKVLAIPVYYKDAQNFDSKIIKSLNLDERFDEENKVYLIDLDYLKEEKSIVGFSNELPFALLNTYSKNYEFDDYDFNIKVKSYHFGMFYGRSFYNKLSKLNFELNKIGVAGFTNKFETYSFVFDYFALYQSGMHLGYTYIPVVKNNDRFSLNGYSFSYGSNYSVGNKWFLTSFGLNLTYGNMTLLEETQNNQVPNLIQKDGENIVVYTNDLFTIDPNIDLRLTFPIISLNARVGYAFDVSGKYWRLDGKMKDFTKTSFSAPYIQIGVSYNFKEIH